MFNRYRIVGHSKGGYLAIYAAIHAKPAVKRRIIEVYSDDGPGLRDKQFSEEDMELLKTKYRLIVPEKDGVGMIYEMASNKKICKVDVFNIVSAHSMFTWQVEGNKVVTADRFKYESDLSREVILDILHETTGEERSIFVNELFARFAQEQINTLSEISNRGIPVIYNTLKRLMDESSESRIFAGKMMKILSRNIGSDIQQSLSLGRDIVKGKVSDISSDLSQALSERKDIVMEKVSDISSSAGAKIKEMLPRKKSEQSETADESVNETNEEQQ